MTNFPSSIQNLINEFSKLPGLGPKSAERLVFYLIERPDEELKNFGQCLQQLKQKVTFCSICQNVTETNPCPICKNPKRNQTVICVVAKPQDVIALEKTNVYGGVYQILGGALNPLTGVKLENLKITPLLNRIKNNNIVEVILGLNPDIEGETTALSLVKTIKKINPKIKITRLARGLPMGSDLEYADEVTLSSALRGRREV